MRGFAVRKVSAIPLLNFEWLLVYNQFLINPEICSSIGKKELFTKNKGVQDKP